MSDSTANTFSYAVGGLALISTISSLLLYSSAYLPKAQLRVLDELLKETRSIYHTAETEGLLPIEIATKSQAKLLRYEDKCETLREVTYRAQSLNDQIRMVVEGHATKIMRLASDVGILRATLVTTSQREKARREATRRMVSRSVEELPENITSTDTCDVHSSNSPNEPSGPGSSSEAPEQNTCASNPQKFPSYLRLVSFITYWCSNQQFNDRHHGQRPSGRRCSDSLSRTMTLVEAPSSSDEQSSSNNPATFIDRPVMSRWWWFRKLFSDSPQGDGLSPNTDLGSLLV